jgi:hypothetical protein
MPCVISPGVVQPELENVKEHVIGEIVNGQLRGHKYWQLVCTDPAQLTFKMTPGVIMSTHFDFLRQHCRTALTARGTNNLNW